MKKIFFFLIRPYERTIDDLEIIYDELLHVKALSHLSSVVKRELAGVLIFEAHPYKGEVCQLTCFFDSIVSSYRISSFLFFSFLIMIITHEKSRAKFIRERGEEGPMC